ncbi:MAG: EamA family transporter RarD [Sutterellaceae bacterium]|nr:EamA family transporter RarD [Sutterellaceae bacterium]
MPLDSRDNAKTIGLTGALLAYLCWGMMPMYWSLLKGAGSWEVIAHRATWSPLALILLLLCFGRLGELKRTILSVATVHRRQGLFLICAAAFAAVNWWINVLAAQVDRVTELGLGMFITPLISVALAVIFFREKLPLAKWLSVAAGLTGLLLQAVDYGRIPWIAIGVSVTWAIYGAFKKKIPLDPWMSNTIEGLILMPMALVYIAYLSLTGASQFFGDSQVLTFALLGTGIVTTIPMLAFAYAAVNLPLNVLGFCQYLNPIFTMSVGIFILGEPFKQSQIVPLLFIAASIVLFLWAEVRGSKKIR